MKYVIIPMKYEYAKLISSWRYDEPYSIYSMDGTEECLQELMDGNYYSVVDENSQLIGYFCFGTSAQVPRIKHYGVYNEAGYIDIGLGMRPDMTGKGAGMTFFQAGIEFGKKHFQTDKMRLTVAAFNERAIKTYKRAGFTVRREGLKPNTDNPVEFKTMELIF